MDSQLNHNLIKPMPKYITEYTQRPNKTKSRQELKQETGKALEEQGYLDIITATQNTITVH